MSYGGLRRAISPINSGKYRIFTRLIEKVLDFSRVERGEKQYHLVSGAITPVVARTVEVYGQYLKRRGFLVETDLATELPPVRFDADAVAAAVVNLVDNAAKYSGTPKFGYIRVSQMA